MICSLPLMSLPSEMSGSHADQDLCSPQPSTCLFWVSDPKMYIEATDSQYSWIEASNGNFYWYIACL